MDTKHQIKAVNQLGKYLRSHCDKIFEKSIPFVVDSALFWFISEVIQSLLSSDATIFPEVNHGFYDYVMFLSDFFEQTPSLCITLTEAVKGVNSIPGNLDLSYFRSLQFLELRKIPPHMVTSLHTVRTNLRKLKCSRCIDSLSEILCPQHGNSNNNNNQGGEGLSVVATSILQVWPELKDIDFSFNRIKEIDAKAIENFELTPSVETLNLSRNKIFAINDLFSRVLNSLTTLNLNYNQLKTIPAVPPNLKVLLIAHNYITYLTCATFSSLKNLETLDISSNMIADENELDKLGELRCLKTLMLLGNPISYLESYRHTVCCNINRLSLTRTFMLDNKKLSVSEVRRALEFTKHHKFVPFTVSAAPREGSSSSRSAVSQQLSNLKSLTQSYDSTCSSIRSSCRKKAKMRVPHVYDPDEEETASVSTCGENQPSSSSLASESTLEQEGEVKEKTQQSSDSGSDVSEVATGVRNAIESLREKYGEENWLLKQAAVEVGKLLRIPVTTPSENKVSSTLLSQSLPGAGSGFHNKSFSSNSFYLTAIDLDDSRILSPDVDKSPRIDSILASANSRIIQDNLNSTESNTTTSNNISDDSLVFYPCSSTLDLPAENVQTPVSGEDLLTDSTLKFVSPGEFRFTASAGPTPYESLEIFSDPDGKSMEFYYFQSGQMFKLVILDNYLYEVDRKDSRISVKWDLKSLETLTDEKFMSETETVEFKLTFDTMKKNLRERVYIMTNKDFSRFDEAIGPFLEFRTMQEFSEAFQCLKCNAQFSKGLADKTVYDQDGIVREVPICNNPDCRSELLVLLDSAPLPNNQCLNVQSELPRLSPVRGASPVSGTPSTSKPIFDLKFFRVPLASSTPKPFTSGFTDEAIQEIQGSKEALSDLEASSKQDFKSSSEPTSLNAINTKSESDIETLSCTSSSIEVIGNNNGDSASGSDIVEVPEAVELSVPEVTNKLQKSSGVTMTDSTSSGSCAESVCTAYEKKSSSSVTQNPHRSHNPSSAFSVTLGGSFTTSSSTTLTCPVKYDYENFSKVDHRLQLFCEISVFKGSDERLLALAKVLIISDSSQYSGIVIFSNKKLYIYKIVGLEGDKPESWLQRVKSFGLEKLVCLNVLIGRHGVGVELQGKYYALIFRDSTRTSNFLECFLSDICGEMTSPPLVRDLSHTHKALLSPTNSVVYFGVLQYASCENEKTHTAAILLTNVEILLISDLLWMGATREGNVEASQVRQLTSLRQVESHEADSLFVRLIFGSSHHAFWELYFDSQEERNIFVTNLQLYTTKGIPFISLSQPIEP